MSAEAVGFSLLTLGAALLVGKIIRVKVRWIQSLFLPSSIVAGTILLLLGPQVLGRFDGPLKGRGLFTQAMSTTWSALPGLLISVIFATMFLGQRLPSPGKAAKLLGPQLSLGTALASSQYVVGLLLAGFVLVPLFSASRMTGSLIEMAFEGGHGTAAGMRGVMDKLGFKEGGDLAVGLATVGIVSGIVVGIALINWGVRTGKTEILKGNVKMSLEEQKGLFRADEHYSAGTMTSRPASVEPLSLHMGIVAVAILIGWSILEGLRWIERVTYGKMMIDHDTHLEIFTYVPLFPMALLGGVILQLIARKTGAERFIDHQMMLRIQGWALDFLIVAAIATLSLQAVGRNLGVFLILSVAGIAVNVVHASGHRPVLVRAGHRRLRPVDGSDRHRPDPHAHHRPPRREPRIRGLRIQAARLRAVLRRGPGDGIGHSDHLLHGHLAVVLRHAGHLPRRDPLRSVLLRPSRTQRPRGVRTASVFPNRRQEGKLTALTCGGDKA